MSHIDAVRHLFTPEQLAAYEKITAAVTEKKTATAAPAHERQSKHDCPHAPKTTQDGRNTYAVKVGEFITRKGMVFDKTILLKQIPGEDHLVREIKVKRGMSRAMKEMLKERAQQQEANDMALAAEIGFDFVPYAEIVPAEEIEEIAAGLSLDAMTEEEAADALHEALRPIRKERSREQRMELKKALAEHGLLKDTHDLWNEDCLDAFDYSPYGEMSYEEGERLFRIMWRDAFNELFQENHVYLPVKGKPFYFSLQECSAGMVRLFLSRWLNDDGAEYLLEQLGRDGFMEACSAAAHVVFLNKAAGTYYHGRTPEEALSAAWEKGCSYLMSLYEKDVPALQKIKKAKAYLTKAARPSDSSQTREGIRQRNMGLTVNGKNVLKTMFDICSTDTPVGEESTDTLADMLPGGDTPEEAVVSEAFLQEVWAHCSAKAHLFGQKLHEAAQSGERLSPSSVYEQHFGKRGGEVNTLLSEIRRAMEEVLTS